MPAPVPIDIRYANPVDIARLAAASGQAGFNMDRFTAARQDYAQRAALDNAFLMNEFNRRSSEQQAANELSFRYSQSRQAQSNADRAFDLQRAIAEDRSGRGWANIGSREDIAAANRDAALERTLAARRGGSATRGRSAQDMTLVPETGPVEAPAEEATASISPSSIYGPPEAGRTVERYRGQTIQYGGDKSQAEARAGVSPKAGMVPRYVRGQLDMIDASDLPEDRKNMLRIAARGGQLKDDQLVDDIRGAAIRSSTARDLATKKAEQMQYDIGEISTVLDDPRLPDDVKAMYGRKKLGISTLDEAMNEYTDADILQKLRNQRQILQTNLASVKPITNSSGKTPTGGNPITITTQQEWNQLPSGTYYIDSQSGRLGRKP